MSTPEATPRAQAVRSIRAAFAGLLPAAGFYFAYRRLGSSWAVAIGIVLTLAVFPVERRMTGRNRWAWLGLVGVAGGAALALVTRNPKLFFLRAVIGDVGWGVVMLGSVAIRRPLIGVFARWVVAIPESYVRTREYLRSFGLVTFVWGAVTLARAGLRGYLIARGSVDRFVAVQVATGPPVFACLLGLAIWYPRRVARDYALSQGIPPEVVERVMRGESFEGAAG